MLTLDPAHRLHGPTTTSTTPLQMNGTITPILNTHHKHIWIVTGPAGCGKSTVGQSLSKHYGVPYLEGDEFHPVANIEKMAKGIPLTDADRWDWLILLREQATAALEEGASGVVLTCSALKRKYRDVIRMASYNDHHVQVHFMYLRADETTLLSRVKARQGHYMKEDMVKSQFASLEPPTQDELDKDVFAVDVSGLPTEVLEEAQKVVDSVLAKDAGPATN